MNAYSVHDADAGTFSDVSADSAALFVAADHSRFVERGHPSLARTVEAALDA